MTVTDPWLALTAVHTSGQFGVHVLSLSVRVIRVRVIRVEVVGDFHLRFCQATRYGAPLAVRAPD